MDQQLEDKVRGLLQLQEKEIYSQLGAFLNEDKIGLHSDSEEDAKDGEHWFKKNLVKIRASICENSEVKKLIASGNKLDDLHLAVSVAAFAVDLFGKLHAPFIAVIICKKGLTIFCAGQR